MVNMMTCSGFDNGILGGCSMAWFGFAILVFLGLIVRRQCEDGVLSGMPYNIVGGFVGGLGTYLIIIAISGSARWGLVGGVIGLAVVGYLFSLFMGGSESG